jgi:peptidoglycan hydrolase CwlO-like protein
MAIVQSVTTLNIDGNVLQVADLGPKVQALVGVYNEWNQKLADAQGQFALVQAALNDLSRQIIVQIKADSDAAAAAANDAAAAAATPAPASVATDPATVTTDASPASTQTAKE